MIIVLELKFPLFFHPIPIDKEKVLFEDERIVISNLLLNHSIDSSEDYQLFRNIVTIPTAIRKSPM